MNDYESLKAFWNNGYKDAKPEAITEKWITNKKFNEILNRYINTDSKVLDYGSGSGWGLIEAYNTVKFKEGLGIDTASDAVKYSNECAKLSGFDCLKYVSGDESLLDDKKEYFDFGISINVLDVLPEEIMLNVFDALYNTMKPGSYFLVGLNPSFTEDEMVNLIKMEKNGNYYYKNGILRANEKTTDEWIKLLSTKFEVVEHFKFALVEQEEKYPRNGYLLKKN